MFRLALIFVFWPTFSREFAAFSKPAHICRTELTHKFKLTGGVVGHRNLKMNTPKTLAALLLCFVFLHTLHCEGQEKTPGSNVVVIDPKEIANLVQHGAITFDPERRIIVNLSEGGSFIIDPVKPRDKERYIQISSLQETTIKPLQVGPRPPPPPLPPRPWPPLPSPDHGGKPPPKPPPPGVPKPTPKSLVQNYADTGVIVGRLKTDGLDGPNGSLAKGVYTVILTVYEGHPIAALIDANGNYVLSTSNIFFLDTPMKGSTNQSN